MWAANSSVPDRSVPTRFGLLVGVDQYLHFPKKNQLSSCVRDAELMAEILEDRFDFRGRDVRRLHNAEATQEGLRAALQELVDRARPDDQVVFYFSGHGSWMTDPNRPTGRAETLVPHDSGRRSHDPPAKNRDLRDDELYRWVLKLSDITPYVTVILDSCRAAGALRDDPAGAQRKGLPGDPSPEIETPSVLRGEAAGAAFRETGPSGWLPPSERHVLLAACRADEPCFMHDLPDGSKHGAFTFFLARELLSMAGGATYREVGERLRPVVSALYPSQTPQVEGARDRELFGVETLAPLPYLPVHRQDGATVVLGGGAVHGVSLDSRWTLQPSGTRRADESSSLARFIVTAVRATEAEGQLSERVERVPELPPGCRAFELERRLSVALPVRVLGADAGTAEHQALHERIAGSRLLTRVADDGAGAAWTVRRVPGSSPSCWEIVDPSGETRIGIQPIAAPQWEGRPVNETAAVVEALEAFARRQHVLNLEPPATTPSLQDALEVELLCCQPDGAGQDGEWRTAEPEADGFPVFHDGDDLGLRIHNRSALPLYLHVLDLGLSGAVTLLHPFPGKHEALPGGRVEEVGLCSGEELEVSVPEVFAGEEGLEWLKIFATTCEADLSFLSSEGPVLRQGSDRGPLDRLLGAAWVRGKLREELTQPAVVDSWVTARIPFRVRR